MDEIFERTARLIGKDALATLKKAHVAVFGLGGVGGSAAEALCRGGVGTLSLFDGDKVAVSNINRQFFATVNTVGLSKTDAAAERLKSLNPDIELFENCFFYTPETADEVDLSQFDYIIDAVDMVTAKIELIVRANAAGVPIISCMGTGNKLDPTQFEVCDIYKTSVCPLARVMRKELKERGIKKLKVLYSKEPPIAPKDTDDARTPASISFVPPVAGMILAGEAIKDLIKSGEG
ncbi:MAG: tRNA threonylcarbamoyladenosine dehydratase [Oscillospiraceae bacterium]|nr:tRNA threonylcarbamoyladenosine dehydratase [Oscillospiraceae bacterium]